MSKLLSTSIVGTIVVSFDESVFILRVNSDLNATE